MLNECLIHLFDYTCLNVMCVCSSLDGSNQKDFWSFYMYLEVIFITLCVHVICLPFFFFFFNFLSMFYVEKTSVRIFGYLFWWLASREIQSRFLTTHFGDLQAARPSHEFTQNGFATQLATCQLQIAQKQLFKELFVGKLF